jgi:hypothetical protein
MSKLELFLHDQPEPTPVLLKAAWPMCSSRRSTRFWTVTAVWGVC